MGDVGEIEKFRKIVVAIDESEESMYALLWCLKNIVVTNPNNSNKNNNHSEDRLVLLHVKRPVVVYHGLDALSLASMMSHDALSSLDRRDRDMALWVLHKAEKLCKEYDVKVESRIENGDPRDVICETVKAMAADLLIMGSHGYGPITRKIIGSVSDYCVQGACCPVLVAKMPLSMSNTPASKTIRDSPRRHCNGTNG